MLIVAWYPRSGGNWRDEAAEDALAHVIEVNRAIRNIRAEKRLDASVRPKVYLRAGGYSDALAATSGGTATLSRVEPEVVPQAAQLPKGEYAFARIGATEVAVALPQVDTAAERARLEKEFAEADAYIANMDRQLSNDQFLAKAPAHVVESMRTKLTEARARATGLRARLETL